MKVQGTARGRASNNALVVQTVDFRRQSLSEFAVDVI